MHILIIDDTQGDHDLAVAYLEEAGGSYQFSHGYNAEEGLQLFRDNPIDCILLDYHMPGKNGLDVLRQLSESDKIVPVIMMTGEGNESVAVNAMKLGSQDYLPKRTLTASALKRAVERAVERNDMIWRMEQYRVQLERSNYDLEQFANIVAHDLKSPLRAVTQHLGLIYSRNAGLLDEKSKRSLDFAVEGATRMRLLIEALFEYARLGFCEPSFETVSLQAIADYVKHDLSSLIDECGACITQADLPEVNGDSILLAQLLQNLIANAIKYCTVAPVIHIDAVQQNDMWCIRVRDNGIGIPKAQYKQIFAIFRRLHVEEAYPGIGLGLAVCDRIVKQHGGMIGVESEPGKGSCFYFTLPLLQGISKPKKRMAYG